METITCRNCGAVVEANFCGQCGQKRFRRITLQSLAKEVYDGFFDFESPFLKSLILLSVNPGKVYREYLEGAHKRYFSPVKYSVWILAICVAFAGLMDAAIIPTPETLNDNPEIKEEMASVIAYLNAAIIPFTFVYSLVNAVFAWAFFRKEKYTILEWFIPILLCYSHLMILTIPALLIGEYGSNTHMLVATVVSIAYMTWGVAEMFPPRRGWNYLKAGLVSLLGQIAVMFTAGLLFGVFWATFSIIQQS